ncbi:putative transcriptional regulatory protein HAH1 [Wickerhamiella sorbophila]|uniref:Putative transcriptional regulatory protein HAH1 n=1 Tax=Wickerhamiella sorbophila TaxID=45607 RepID=A0A2T0FCK2_9ASCO|nr:putative transcriptional regulatory protein HAH1 [Wickerhamiella sorbophila]PRT52734.1 putative transcriptional regulatory protein HAH1 [Wickerhamiella sorbophila]
MLRANCRYFSSSFRAWAGHSKWQNIKHTKARNDAKRSNTNTKMANMITVAAREGGGTDLALNVRLATMVENALKMSIPKRVIEGAIARASKGAGSAAEESVSITYEGVGPGGVAYVVETLTDNKNRTAQQVRAAFMRFKGSLSPTSFLFQRKGWIQLGEGADFDEVFEKAIDLGAEDVVEKDGEIVLYTETSQLAVVANEIKKDYKIDNMGLSYEPEPDQAVAELDEETQTKHYKLIDALEELDDVNTVYTNYRE